LDGIFEYPEFSLLGGGVLFLSLDFDHFQVVLLFELPNVFDLAKEVH